MRKLVTIRKVSEICPIKGADKIELAKIDGWQCVVKKGDFKPGDLGVYFEIDSFLPQIPQFEFLRKSGTKTDVDGVVGYRIRTMKLRKTLSQGLFMPINDFPMLCDTVTEGSDVSDAIGVKLYEPPIPANLRGEVVGLMPSFIRKTDQERIQNVLDNFQMSGVQFEATEKLDGTSTTIYYKDGQFGVCSRNFELKNTEVKTAYWLIAEHHDLRNKMAILGLNIAIQGELIGEGVNKNPYHLKGREIYVFDIWDIDKQEYISAEKREKIVNDLGLKHVPKIEITKIFEKCKTIEEILQYVNRKSILSPDTPMEGVVFKSIGSEPYVSFKVINNEVLLKEE